MFFGPLDEDQFERVLEIPTETAMIGVWTPDSFSVQLVKERYGDSVPPIELILSANRNFGFENAPDFIGLANGEPLNGEFESLYGNWDLRKENGSWGLDLDYGPCKMFASGERTTEVLRMNNGVLAIIMFIGDPDQGDRLLFRKELSINVDTHKREQFVPHTYAKTFPFATSSRVELLSYPVRYTWDTIAKGGETYINDELIDKYGRVTIPKRKVKDRLELDATQRQRLFALLCNEPCAEEERMVAACYDPRHALFFYDTRGKAFAHIELCLECYQERHTDGIPVQDFCASKVNALHQLFEDCGVTYFGGPEDWQ